MKIFILELLDIRPFSKNFANVNSFKPHGPFVMYITNLLRNVLICHVNPMRYILILSENTEEQRCVVCPASPSWRVAEQGFKSKWTKWYCNSYVQCQMGNRLVGVSLCEGCKYLITMFFLYIHLKLIFKKVAGLCCL